MGTKLSTASKTFPPSVNVRGEKGQYLVGKLVGRKSIESQFVDDKTGQKKLSHYYTFEVMDTTMEIQRKEGKEWVAVPLNEGEQAEILAPTRLHNALSQAKDGQVLKITALGLGKSNGKGGRPYDYDVEVL